MTPRNNKAPLQYYTKLCASFQIHQWIQIGVTVRKRPIWVKIDDFFRPVSLQFDVWPWKTIGHLFYATSSFVHHCVAIGEFKLELQSGNALFFSRVTSQFDVWPWKTTGHLHCANSSFLHHFIAIGEFKLELQSGNAWFGSKSTIFLVVWPCNLTYDLEKTIWHLFYATSSCVHHFVAIGEFKLELQSGNAQFGSNRRFLELCDLEIWRMTLKNNRAPLLSNMKLW